jgi:glyoxylase-like metal-dependent hydrolase (beta-lactamase superfamily II)
MNAIIELKLNSIMEGYMRVANGVEMLATSTNFMGKSLVVHPTVIWDNDTVILVDAGYPGQASQIRAEMEKAGLSFDKLNKIILTHHDLDHIGGVLSIVKESPISVEVLAHEEERPYISGEKRPLKVEQLEAKLHLLPEDMKVAYAQLKAGFEKCKVNVDKTLTDEEELPYNGGITVIFTPGHTLGHISLYLKQSKILITGDILAVEDGTLIKPAESINFDKDLSAKSLKKLIDYDIAAVICYHGGFYKDNVNERIAELAAE